MITDTLDNLSCYQPLGSRIARGLAWLAACPSGAADGRYDIEGDKLYALVQSYESVPATQKKYEAHRAYADLQYVVAGAETIHYAPVGSLLAETAYDVERDFQLYRDPTHDMALRLSAGRFALFFTQDAHKPGCISDVSCAIRKIVIKIRL
jgi:YhcH/YjgK/YiaL family protein